MWGSLRIADAEVNQGDSEVREALLTKAEFFARIGKREEAMAALKATEEKACPRPRASLCPLADGGLRARPMRLVHP
jgi:hypothetical protein